MNTTKQHQLTQQRKTCAAKGCASLGVYQMEILFIGKKGWFCRNCKEVLTHDGFLIRQVTETGDYDRGVNNLVND